jgi:D-amino peptidase
MMTDIEGVAGVMNFEDWCYAGGRYNDVGKRLLTMEVNAAVEGFCSAGVESVTVIDGHGSGAIVPELLDERATFIRGPRDESKDDEFYRQYDAMAYVGQHAKAVIDFMINGVSVGEYGCGAAAAAEANIPVIFASGEEAFCREAEALTPGVLTVAVKRGLLDDDGHENCTHEEYAKAKLGAEHLSPIRARKLIHAGAQRAAEQYFADRSVFHGFKLTAPFHIVCRFRASGDFPPQSLEAFDEKSVIAAYNKSWPCWHLSKNPKPLNSAKT